MKKLVFLFSILAIMFAFPALVSASDLSNSNYVTLFNGEQFDMVGLVMTEEVFGEDVVRIFTDENGIFIALEVVPLQLMYALNQYGYVGIVPLATGSTFFNHSVGDRHVGQCSFRTELDFWANNQGATFNRIWVTRTVHGGFAQYSRPINVHRSGFNAWASFEYRFANQIRRDDHSYTVSFGGVVTIAQSNNNFVRHV